jgi:hypothetical protein
MDRASVFLGFNRAGKVSMGIYKGLNPRGSDPEVITLILSCYLLLSLKTPEYGKA